jgi:hypothetical protein
MMITGKELIEQLTAERDALAAQVKQLQISAWSAYGDGYYDGYLQYAEDCGDTDYKEDALRRSENAEANSVYAKNNAVVNRLAARDAKVVDSVIDNLPAIALDGKYFIDTFDIYAYSQHIRQHAKGGELC